jgi:hypothetical protein
MDVFGTAFVSNVASENVFLEAYLYGGYDAFDGAFDDAENVFLVAYFQRQYANNRHTLLGGGLL